ncbi:MAG: protein-glutamate O-methyltransferase CheR [Rhodobacteraceae bacterium]|nr:MAG: protein-glutamate O-methyltransferase CheR [Paracoccaceae bacterium]
MTRTLTTPTPESFSDLPFERRDFEIIARIAKTEFGLHIDIAKEAMIRSRLTKRIRHLNLPSFEAYCALVDTTGSEERDHFISALTTNVTHFYREVHHFEALEAEVLPPLLDQARQGRKIRLWSAACSTGPEAYSIAGSVLHLCPDADRLDIRILATDLDPVVLARAEAGTYRAEECRMPGEAWHRRVFGAARPQDDRLAVRPELRRLITFRRLNLNGAWPTVGRFDAIFCRNVAIYFDKSTQETLWGRLAECLDPGGYLFIGHSERVSGAPLDQLRSAGITTYRRV